MRRRAAAPAAPSSSPPQTAMPRSSRLPVLAALAVMALAGTALGHGGPGAHGGRIEDAGPWHAELVTAGREVAVYLSDADGRPLAPRGFSGTAILVASGGPARIPLAPDGPCLAGTAPVVLGDRPAGALRLTGPGGASGSARFE